MRFCSFLVVVFVACVTLTSCGGNINLVDKYKYQTQIDSLKISALDHVIQKSDLLAINFSVAGSSEAQQLMEIYNGGNRSMAGGNLTSSGYLVGPDGNITISSIGEVEVAGKTKNQVVEILQQKLKKYIKITPVVTVRVINFTVYIEGEVGRPGAINVQNEAISLQEAIAIAGGTTPFAVLSDVELIRRENGVTKFVHIDLRGDELYTDKKEYYFLKQGDYINIKADKEKFIASNSSATRTASYATAALSLLVTLFTLFRN